MTTSLLYRPISVRDIPVLCATENDLKYVAASNPSHWIQPKKKDIYQRGQFYEEVPVLDDPNLCYGIHIEIYPMP